jgi:hypothetical protein
MPSKNEVGRTRDGRSARSTGHPIIAISSPSEPRPPPGAWHHRTSVVVVRSATRLGKPANIGDRAASGRRRSSSASNGGPAPERPVGALARASTASAAQSATHHRPGVLRRPSIGMFRVVIGYTRLSTEVGLRWSAIPATQGPPCRTMDLAAHLRRGARRGRLGLPGCGPRELRPHDDNLGLAFANQGDPTATVEDGVASQSHAEPVAVERKRGAPGSTADVHRSQ